MSRQSACNARIEQVSGHGQGLGHDDFKKRFKEICEEHLREKRARIFAFVFYDMTHGTVREALKGADGFRRLDETSGKDVSFFYLHDRAVDRFGDSFNRRFMRALSVTRQAKPLAWSSLSSRRATSLTA